jgi:hypothetical protein
MAKALARLPYEFGTSIGEVEAMRTALEERHPEGVFELPHPATHGPLSDAQLPCGTSEAQVVGNAQRPADRYGVNRG